MALRGSLGDFALADVFRLVTLSGKSGVLRLGRPGSTGSVWFRSGDVFFATSDARTELLGDRLVAAGRITPDQLSRALQERAEEGECGRRLGEVMLDGGMITQPVLEAFVQEQIQDTIFDLFLWDSGDFEFDALQEPPEDQDIGLSVSVENIIMESSRRLDELSKMRLTASGSAIVYRLSSAPGERTVDISLTATEWRVAALTDGTRTVDEIASVGGLSAIDVSRTLHGLLGAGLLEVVGDEAAAVPEPAPAPARAPAPESVPEPAPEPAPAPAREPAPKALIAAEPVADADAETAPSSSLSAPLILKRDPVLAAASMWPGLGDELTALTGGARKGRTSQHAGADAQDAEDLLICTDTTVDRATIEAVLAGIEKL
jgi:hypothetical protein